MTKQEAFDVYVKASNEAIDAYYAYNKACDARDIAYNTYEEVKK